eukprot:SAG22_NODE_834_length_6927_cov_7.202402_5_plen_146_part_00
MSNLTIGKIANNSITLVLKSELHIGIGNDGTMRFSVDIPNHMGGIIAGKSRCLLQVQSVTVARVRVDGGHPGALTDIDGLYKSPISCGVRINGLANSVVVDCHLVDVDKSFYDRMRTENPPVSQRSVDHTKAIRQIKHQAITADR